MARKTGSYNLMFFSQAMLDGDINAALREYYKTFDEMVDDYRNGGTKFRMSNVYGWCESFIPVDYGLVFIDFDTNTVHSLQGYDTPCHANGQAVANEVKYEPDSIFIDFIKNGMVDVVIKSYNQKTEEVSTTVASVHEIFSKNDDIAEKLVEIANEDAFVSYAIRGWNVVNYEESFDGFIKFFNEVRHLLNDEEVSAWRDFATDRWLNDEYCDDVVEEMEDNDSSEEEISKYVESKLSELTALIA